LVYFWNSGFWKYSNNILAGLEGHWNSEGATKAIGKFVIGVQILHYWYLLL